MNGSVGGDLENAVRRVRRGCAVAWLTAVLSSTASAVTPVVYTLPGNPKDNNLHSITKAPDGTMWALNSRKSTLVKVTPDGQMSEIPTPTPDSYPNVMTLGPDGRLWFAEATARKLATLKPDGTIVEYPLSTGSGVAESLVAGADGNLWFTNSVAREIGRVTMDGKITIYPLDFQHGGLGGPSAMAAGPDGNLWFVNSYENWIGKFTLDTAQPTIYPLPSRDGEVYAIAPGPDGNMWFVERRGNKVGKITPGGTITEYALPTPDSSPKTLAVGPDGNLWFAEWSGKWLGRVTPDGTVVEVTLDIPLDPITSFGVGADGNLWFTLYHNQVGKVDFSKASLVGLTQTSTPSGVNVAITRSGEVSEGAMVRYLVLDASGNTVGDPKTSVVTFSAGETIKNVASVSAENSTRIVRVSGNALPGLQIGAALSPLSSPTIPSSEAPTSATSPSSGGGLIDPVTLLSLLVALAGLPLRRRLITN